MTIQVPQEVSVREQLYLRALALNDFLPLWILVESNRGYLEKWLPWVETTTSIEKTRYFVQGALLYAKQNREFHWGIFKDELLIGLIGLHHVDWDHFSATLGYWLSEDQQGQGIMTSSIQTLVPFLYQGMHLRTLEIHVIPENGPSVRVAENSGFTYRETIHQAEQLHDNWQDHLIFEHLIK